MAKNNNDRQDDKLELAQKIANQSQKVAKTYESVEGGFFRIIRMFSNAIDKFMFNPKYGVLVSFLLAVMLYITMNMSEMSNLFKSTTETSATFQNVKIVTEFNSDKWEISGIPETCEVIITGDQATITTQQNSNSGVIVANLSNLTAGTHTIKLTPEKYISGLKVRVDPTNVTVTIKEKVTQNRDISYDYINTDKMDSIYALGTPEFEMTKVAVRASQSTLDSVAFVKALIDVKGVTGDFTQEAKLVAYDQNGNIVNADIKPETVKVNVKVTSPNKQVPVVVEPQGEIPNGKSIESITMDHSSITVFAPETVLNKLDKVTVTFDASQLTSDSRLYKGINLPTGVKQLSVTKINMEIKLGDTVTRVIEDVPLNYRNYTAGIKASYSQSKVAVEITGTQANVDKITVDDIYAYIDMQNITAGEAEVPVMITPKNESLVKFTSKTPNITVRIVNETEDNTDTQGDAN